jgi:hypothetical protein
MKSFKNLFLIVTVIISSFTFAADGAGGGSKEDPAEPPVVEAKPARF